jgi:hypothetical protein
LPEADAGSDFGRGSTDAGAVCDDVLVEVFFVDNFFLESGLEIDSSNAGSLMAPPTVDLRGADRWETELACRHR